VCIIRLFPKFREPSSAPFAASSGEQIVIVLLLFLLLFGLLSLVLYYRMRRRNKEEARTWARKQIALLKIVMLLVFAVGFTQVQPFLGETRLINAILGVVCIAAAAFLYWLNWTKSGNSYRERRIARKATPPK
jgi:peptidoglycan/LPS O-acetylase OafA/YrhL